MTIIPLELPMFHQVLTSEFDDFLLVCLRAGGDNAVDELLLLFCCSEVDKPDERLQYVHFLRDLCIQVCSSSAGLIVVGRRKVAIGAIVFRQ
ncbi:MAG: hypothetical protein LBD75_04080 [Candidatus Peribacteria bacterium]|nr:hypothetical protein [Candidatus Peribacteria bacterium]